jgi:HAD superfamily hydrolase (TIGR01509 family)
LSSFDGLIFDCDGTLVDTMPVHYQAWIATLNLYGIPFPEDRFYALGGVPPDRIISMLAKEHGVELDVMAVTDQKENDFHHRLDALEVIEPVVAIAKAHRGRVPMAVATGSPDWSARRSLEQVGIIEWFDAIVSSEAVENPKPAPDVFLEAARRIGIDPTRCRAFEDTEIGIASARAAGMDVIDIRTLL